MTEQEFLTLARVDREVFCFLHSRSTLIIDNVCYYDPECEGFIPTILRTSKEKGSSHIDNSCKTTMRESAQPSTLVVKPSKTACPKTHVSNSVNKTSKDPDKSLIQTVLKLKDFKGSVVMEKICCGKSGCHCHSGALHGPYPYLHYYSNGKVKRRYLSKIVSALLSHSTEELERMLHETEAVLGQERELEHG